MREAPFCHILDESRALQKEDYVTICDCRDLGLSCIGLLLLHYFNGTPTFIGSVPLETLADIVSNTVFAVFNSSIFCLFL